MSNRPFEYLVCVVMPEYCVVHSVYSSYEEAKIDLEESLSDGAEMVSIYKLIKSVLK